MRLLKLIPMIALFAVIASVAAPKPALANLVGLTTSTPTPAIGQSMSITAGLSGITAGTVVTLTATSGTFQSALTSNGEFVAGVGGVSISYTATTTTTASTMSAVWSCTTAGSITFTLTQSTAPSAGPATLTSVVACAALNTTPPAQAPSLTSQVHGTCTVAGQLLTANGGHGAFSTAPQPVNMTVISPSTATCLGPGIFSVSYVCSLDGIVTFTIPTTPATLTCSGSPNPYTPANQFCPMYNAVAPYGGGVASPGTAPYTGSPFPYGYNGALNQTTGLPYAYNFNPTAPYNPSAPFNGYTYPPNYSSVVPYNGLTYPAGYNPVAPNFGQPGVLGTGYPYNGLAGVPGGNYAYNGLQGGFFPNSSVPNGAPVGTGSNYCPPNPATEVSVSTTATTVACSGNATVEVLVRDAAGLPVANGQKVSLTSTLGVMHPATVTTLDGKVESKFMAPPTGSGTAIISIVAQSLSSGDISNTTSINVDCPASATAPPPAPAAPIYSSPFYPPSTGQGIATMPAIRPPSTGDAGLADACLLDE